MTINRSDHNSSRRLEKVRRKRGSLPRGGADDQMPQPSLRAERSNPGVEAAALFCAPLWSENPKLTLRQPAGVTISGLLSFARNDDRPL
jgi:hypothetical protein